MDLSSFLRPYERRLAACAVASFLALSAIVILHTGSPYGDLANRYTDHLHHAHATWALLKRGFDIYRFPFGVVASEAPYPQPAATWPEFPVPYPPGFAGVFFIPAMIGRYWPMTMPVFGKVCIVYLLAISHLAVYAIGIAIRGAGGARPILLLLFWLLCARSSVLGFYDPAWMACGALSSIALAKKRAGTALVWFTTAAFMNFRAVSMLPMGLVAAWRVARGTQTWPRKTCLLGSAAVLGVVSCYSFWLFVTHGPQPGSPIYEACTRPPFESDSIRTTFLWLASLAFSWVAVRAGNWLAALTTVCVTLVTLQHGGHAWHSSMLIAPVLVTGEVDSRKATVMSVYGYVAVWCVLVFQIGYGHEPTLLLEEIVSTLRGLRG